VPSKKRTLSDHAERESLERRTIRAEASSAAARSDALAARKAVVETQAELDRVQRELDLHNRALARPVPKWMQRPPRDLKAHHATLVAFLSDAHFGEVVDADEMNGYNAYNLDIAERRLQRFFDRTILVARHYLSGVHYDGIVLAIGGDTVSGDIHDELTQTNELSTLETVEWSVPRLRAGVAKFAEEFGRIHIVAVPGNHGRREKQKVHKRRSASNADMHIARLLAQSFDDPTITFTVPRAIDVEFDVYSHRFSMEHGDQAKGGDGQVGALGPVKRLTLRKTQQTAEEGRPFDYLLVGHFHQYVPAASQGFVMNGSLKGYDEYARAWHYKPEPAQQALMVVVPEHGITMQTPVLCADRKREGW
jgi:hypothetical protein